MSSYNRELTSL